MIGNKISQKIKSVSKKPATELHSKELHNNDEINEEDVEIAAPQENIHISRRKTKSY